MDKCPVCGWNKELQGRADAVTAEMKRRGELAEKYRRGLVERGVSPMGQCSDCQDRMVPCDFSCVAIN